MSHSKSAQIYIIDDVRSQSIQKPDGTPLRFSIISSDWARFTWFIKLPLISKLAQFNTIIYASHCPIMRCLAFETSPLPPNTGARSNADTRYYGYRLTLLTLNEHIFHVIINQIFINFTLQTVFRDR